MNIAKTVSLIFACISFIIVIGGATYEHLAVVPAWSAAVPASLTMFQGPYALTAQKFWIPIHPVAIALLTIALIFNWRTERRKFIVVTLAGYLLVLAITAVYFVPELMALTQTVYRTSVDPELTRRATQWEALSVVRLAFLLSLAFTLLFGLSRSGRATRITA